MSNIFWSIIFVINIITLAICYQAGVPSGAVGSIAGILGSAAMIFLNHVKRDI